MPARSRRRSAHADPNVLVRRPSSRCRSRSRCHLRRFSRSRRHSYSAAAALHAATGPPQVPPSSRHSCPDARSLLLGDGCDGYLALIGSYVNFRLKTVTNVICRYGPQVPNAAADVNRRLKTVITVICCYSPRVPKAAAGQALAAPALPNPCSPPFCCPRSVCAFAAATRYRCFHGLFSH